MRSFLHPFCILSFRSFDFRTHRFWTSSSCPPPLGLKSLDFKIDITTTSWLPLSFTCFNSISLPLHDANFERSLLMAIRDAEGVDD